jgi:hypothetical protein
MTHNSLHDINLTVFSGDEHTLLQHREERGIGAHNPTRMSVSDPSPAGEDSLRPKTPKGKPLPRNINGMSLKNVFPIMEDETEDEIKRNDYYDKLLESKTPKRNQRQSNSAPQVPLAFNHSQSRSLLLW